jgi:hypothetical protein
MSCHMNLINEVDGHVIWPLEVVGVEDLRAILLMV